ncbi:MAG: hypothetical protein LBJ31_03335 [Treponema sp.]|nr:hypothetical protein [Treponema sp.]
MKNKLRNLNATPSNDIAEMRSVGGAIYHSGETSDGGGYGSNLPNKFVYISPMIVVAFDNRTHEYTILGYSK